MLEQKFSLMWQEVEACGGKSHRACLCVHVGACQNSEDPNLFDIGAIWTPSAPPTNLTVPLSLSSSLCVCVCVCVCDCLTSQVWDHSSTLRRIYGIISVPAEEFEFWTKNKKVSGCFFTVAPVALLIISSLCLIQFVITGWFLAKRFIQQIEIITWL